MEGQLSWTRKESRHNFKASAIITLVPVELFGQSAERVFLARAPLHALELGKVGVAHLIVPQTDKQTDKQREGEGESSCREL